MSVVVRMEMPKNCLNCDLRYECNAFYAPGKSKPFMRGCRIVCQLPEGHGRLVDADEFIKHLFTEWTNGEISNSEWCDIRQWMNEETTIVPADAERSET